MIVVTRLTGPRFAVNPDLLQRVESTPDTILTLIDGTKYIVAESLDDVIALVVSYRARVVAATITATNEPAADLTLATIADRADRADRTDRAERTERTGLAEVTELRPAAADPRPAMPTPVPEPRPGSDLRPATCEGRHAGRALVSVPEGD